MKVSLNTYVQEICIVLKIVIDTMVVLVVAFRWPDFFLPFLRSPNSRRDSCTISKQWLIFTIHYIRFREWHPRDVQVQDSSNYFIVEHQQIFMFIWNQLTNGVQMYIRTYLLDLQKILISTYIFFFFSSVGRQWSNNVINIWIKIGPIFFWSFIFT